MVATGTTTRSGQEPPAVHHADLVKLEEEATETRKGRGGFGGGDNDSHMSTSQDSTKSSQGRKLRQVLQRKQLDVLLQTYSSFIEEPSDTDVPGTNSIGSSNMKGNSAAMIAATAAQNNSFANNNNDFYTISRKSSIEGTNNPILYPNESTDISKYVTDIEETDDEYGDDVYEYDTNDDGILDNGDDEQEERGTNNASTDLRAKMRNSQSLLPNDSDLSGTADHHREEVTLDLTAENSSDNAVAVSKKNKTTKSSSKHHSKEKEGGGRSSSRGKKKAASAAAAAAAAATSRSTKSPTATGTKKQKKKLDFATRMAKANEVIKAFTTRAAQKQVEVAADFQTASKEFRHHLKSGANVMFEDLAEQFDGVVEQLFVGEQQNEQRDDAADNTSSDNNNNSSDSDQRQRQAGRGSGGSRTIRHLNRAAEKVQQDFLAWRDDPNFQPRSHDETVEVMSKQVSNILEPVVVLSEDFNCVGNDNDNKNIKVKEINTPLASSFIY